MRSLLILPLLLIALAPRLVMAQAWPTTRWTLLGDGPDPRKHFDDTIENPRIMGERNRRIAAKHARMLERASRWYASLGFWPPYQFTQDEDVQVESGEAYLAYLLSDPGYTGSFWSRDGSMHLTSNPGFLPASKPMWKLMEASAVHELYHGIQGAITSLRMAPEQRRPGPPDCRNKNYALDWFTEGTAAAVQYRWLERQIGVRYGHPFKGSPRAAWVRHFDQPLHFASIPIELRESTPRMPTISWRCNYGTWYFWYAVGDMLGGDDADRQVAYTRYLYLFAGPWDNYGLANVDAGLKRAAAAYGAIGPYQDGLYDLYPEFVAQYLTEDEFFGHLNVVELEPPGLFLAESSPALGAAGGPLRPMASRAWRVRVHLPENTNALPHVVRFTLDAQDGTDRDDLHLIVDDKAVGRPVDPTVPYAASRRTDRKPPAADGAVEYLVRIANVARDVTDMAPAGFTLRAEVDGYYGNDVSDAFDIGIPSGIAGELPPGFSVRGPGPWKCTGDRAAFDLSTPDEHARSIGRVLPGSRRKWNNHMDKLEIALQKLQRQGGSADITLEQLQDIRRKTLAQIDASIAESDQDYAAAAAEARAGRTTGIAATFIGTHGGEECQMTLGAVLEGRHGGAQIVAGDVDGAPHPDGEVPGFEVRIYPAAQLDNMRASRWRRAKDVRGGWEICTMSHKEQQMARQGATQDCPPVMCTAGRLTLEKAAQGRIAGSFQFDVIRWPEERRLCRRPAGRGTVVGHFNVTSTDDGYDDASLNGPGGVVMPGLPVIDADDFD